MLGKDSLKSEGVDGLELKSVPGLAGTPKVKKYSSLSSKLELNGLVKPETSSSTHSTLHLSRLNIPFQCIEELFQYIEL